FTSRVGLVNELKVLYPAYKNEAPIHLPATGNFIDFTRWEANFVNSGKGEKEWEYWKNKLAGELPDIDLPADRPHLSNQTYKGSAYAFTIDEQMLQSLKRLTSSTGTTLFTTLLSAFYVLLHRLSNQSDILVGTPAVNRNRSEFEETVGYFVNTIVLRTDLSGNPAFTELLERVKQTTLEALDHKAFPFALLVERLRPARDNSRSPLFQVMFNMPKASGLRGQAVTQSYLQNGAARLNIEDLQADVYAVELDAAMFDLQLSVIETGSTLNASLHYNAHLFNKETIVRMADCFRLLLKGILSEPQQPIAQLPVLDEPRLHQLLTSWNNNEFTLPAKACFHHLFEELAAKNADAIAIHYRDQQISYGALNSRANRLARALLDCGAGNKKLVAVLGERNIEFVITLLAIFKAGSAYLPLDPAHPADRYIQVLEQVNEPVILVSSELSSKQEVLQEKLSPSLNASLFNIEALMAREYADDNLTVHQDQDDLAYVIFTSGSTGAPKGAMIEHKGMLNHLYAKIN
ncbi:MAG: condensation domain-containing protein, partial [Chitinophagaceae bacterium]